MTGNDYEQLKQAGEAQRDAGIDLQFLECLDRRPFRLSDFTEKNQQNIRGMVDAGYVALNEDILTITKSGVQALKATGKHPYEPPTPEPDALAAESSGASKATLRAEIQRLQVWNDELEADRNEARDALAAAKAEIERLREALTIIKALTEPVDRSVTASRMPPTWKIHNIAAEALKADKP